MKPRSFHPSIEALEQREVPAVLNVANLNAVLVDATSNNPLTPSNQVTLSSGTLKILGSQTADFVNIYRMANNRVGVETSGGLGRHLNTYDISQVSRIVFDARYGDDTLFVDSIGISIPITAYGGAGDDLLQGGGGNDRLEGGIGQDKLSGAGGNDVLYGDAGNDFLFGGDGNDKLSGGGGYDELRGGAGNDVLDGGYDYFQDYMEGDSGADTFKIHKKAKLFGWTTFHENLVDFNSSEGDRVDYDHHLFGP
jgi:Ca2+-binding RTX toxin-like protein